MTRVAAPTPGRCKIKLGELLRTGRNQACLELIEWSEMGCRRASLPRTPSALADALPRKRPRPDKPRGLFSFTDQVSRPSACRDFGWGLLFRPPLLPHMTTAGSVSVVTAQAPVHPPHGCCAWDVRDFGLLLRADARFFEGRRGRWRRRCVFIVFCRSNRDRCCSDQYG
jgi:hypothetical protein